MPGELKRLQGARASLKNIHYRLTTLGMKKCMTEQSSEDEYANCVSYFKKMITTADAKMAKLPTGHRYTGVFYIRKPYSTPLETIKVDGSAFMREDINSWTLDKNPEGCDICYVRDIFKDKKCRQPIARTEAEPIFKPKPQV